MLGAALLLLAAAGLLGLTVKHPPRSDPVPAVAARGIGTHVATHPTWPLAWAWEAEKLADSREFSPRFDGAIARAVELGPSEREMRKSLGLIALSAWPQLSTEAQALSRANLRFALQTQPRDVLVRALWLRQEALVCGLWTQGGLIAQLCESQRKLRQLCDRRRPGKDLVMFCLERGAVPRYPPRQ